MGLALGVLGFLLGLPRRSFGDDVIERVLAVVAGNLITQSDVAAARVLGLVPTSQTGASGGTDAETHEIVSRLIDRALMLAEVERYAPPEPTAEAVDQEVATVKARFSTPEDFAKALALVGMNDKYLRDTLRQNLRLRAYLEERFTVSAPTEDEIAAYYILRAPRDPIEQVRGQIAAEIVAARRQTLVNEWLAGLRRRAQITEVDLTDR